jgi:SAM-dependent methyltransferase
MPRVSTFPDASFDVVMAQHMSFPTVPNPEAALDEFARVLKPGGEIILISRVGADAGLRRSSNTGFSRRRASSDGGRSSRSNAMRNGRRARPA